MDKKFEVIIIGGSYAGLSAAMALGRSGRKVLLVDDMQPCNAQTPYSHNFLTRDGDPPSEIARIAHSQVQYYLSVTQLKTKVIDVWRDSYGFTVKVKEGTVFDARKLLFATGLKNIMPSIEGFHQCWGVSVLHCPYCHGYEVRDMTLGIIANGDTAFELCKLILNWSKDIILFTDGLASLSYVQLKKLEDYQIRINEKKISRLVHDNGYIKYLEFDDHSIQAVSAVFSRPAFIQSCNLPEKLGCLVTEQGYLHINAFQETNIEGVYAAGDNSQPLRAVSLAVSSGSIAGAAINHSLIEEDF